MALAEDITEEPSALDRLALLSQSPNIAEDLSESELNRIGDTAIREFDIDRRSMEEWLDRMKAGLDLANLVKETKSYPWQDAANVKYPLITNAALQFNAKAYPAIVAGDEVVKVKVYGSDPTGQKAARADRVSEHMSWDLTCNTEEWEEDTDKLLIALPLVGTTVRKWWHDGRKKRCRTLMPGAFVVNNTVKVLADAPRCSEVLPLYPSEVSERIRSGQFRDVPYDNDDAEDSAAILEFIEQHRREDLDGDGYPEPYIVTVHRETKMVARIVADFEPEDVSLGNDGTVLAIERGSYFVAYHFWPSPDGGFFSMGLGLLLADLSETINTIINQMLDAGHMASRGGGFIGSEFRIKGGSQQFRPGEWRKVGATGADVKSAIVPLTFPGADQTLFALLGMLIDAAEGVASTKDILSGEAKGANMPATTVLALIEQGMAVFTAVYKRIFRSLRQEFKLVAKINAVTTDARAYNQFHDDPVQYDPRTEYDLADMDIAPVADPSSVTRMQEAAKAQMLLQMADSGLVDRQEAAMRALQAASIGDIEALAPKPDPMQAQMAQMSAQAAQADLALRLVQIEKALAEIEETRAKTVKTMSEAAKIEMETRLDAVVTNLETIRDAIADSLAGGLGRMAGTPGHGGGQGGFAPQVGPPAAGGDGGILAGPPVAGGTPVRVPPGAGVVGGYL